MKAPENHPALPVGGRAAENAPPARETRPKPAPPVTDPENFPAIPARVTAWSTAGTVPPAMDRARENARDVVVTAPPSAKAAVGKGGKHARSAGERRESAVSSAMERENTADPLVPREAIHYNPPLQNYSSGSTIA